MIRSVLYYYKPYKVYLAIVLVGSVIAAILDLLFPYMVREILNVQLPQKNLQQIFYISGILLALYMLNFGVLYVVSYYGHRLSVGIENDMRRDLFAHLQKMSFSFFDNNKTGQLLSRITSDIAEVSELTYRGPNDLFICGISMLGIICLLVYMNPALGGLISFLLVAKTVHTVIVNKRMKAAFRKSRSKTGELAACTEEALAGIRLVKAFANESNEQQRFMEASNALADTRRQSFKILSYFSSSVNFFTNFTNLAVLVFGGYLIAAGQLKLSDFVAFLLYVNLFMKPVLRMTVFVEGYQRGMAGYQRFYDLMQSQPQIKDVANAITDRKLQGHISFKNVSFGYDSEKMVLKNLNLEIKQGQKVAFVGVTGAGKTTISSLLMRFYELTKGEILIDGVNIRDFSQEFLHKNIGIVQQDVFLFSDSVRYNIAYGRLNADFEEIKKAARMASADEFINRLPAGYDTGIGERGVKLSGGQKQRIAIARAFLKNPPIMVFDEATSSLDTRTEKAVQANLDYLAQNRTTIIIAHRLSTIVNADLVVVLDNGSVAEQGTHKELMARDGLYRKLYESQE